MKTALTPGSRPDVFVASFCADDGDSLSQWRGYCPNGAGYSIGFDARGLDTATAVQVISLVQCRYTYEDQRELIMGVLNRVMNSAEWTRALEDLEDTELYQGVARLWLREFSPVAPIIKHPKFCEEREWRLVTGRIPIEHQGWNVRPGRSMLIPYVPIRLVVHGYFPVKKIVVGPTPHMDLALQAVADWVTRKDMMDCTVENSKIPYRNW